MQSLTLLNLFRRHGTLVAVLTYTFWLSVALVPTRSIAGCCGSSSTGESAGDEGNSTSDECDQGSCAKGKRNVKVSFDPENVKELYHLTSNPGWEWDYTITCGGKDVEAGQGTVTTNQSKNFNICVPEDKLIEVNLVPREPHPYTPQPDPPAADYPGTAGAGTGSNRSNNEIPSLAAPTDSTPKSSPPCVLKFTWCSPCGDGNHCAGENKSSFTVPSGCDSKIGQICSKLGSVNFQINLGRDNSGQPVRLVLKQDDITVDSYNPLHVEYPAVLNRYQMEIWHWFEWEHEVWVDGNPLPVSSGIEGRSSGRRYIYNYTGEDGYKNVFSQLGIAPIGRSMQSTAGVQIPSLPIVADFVEHDPWDHTLGPLNYSGGLGVMVLAGSHAIHTYDDEVKPIDKLWNSEFAAMRTAVHVGEKSGPIDQNLTSPDGSIDDYVRGHLHSVINAPLVFESRWLAWIDSSPVHHYDFANQIVRGLNGTLTGIALKKDGNPTSIFGNPGTYGYIDTNKTGNDPAPIVNATYNVHPMPATNATVGVAGSDTGGSATLGPDVCVETVPDGDNGYTIYAYWRSQLTFLYNGPNKGTYHIDGGPFAAWRVKQVIENEGQPGANPIVGSLRIEERRTNPLNAAAVDAWYEWRQNGASWIVNRNKGTRREVESLSPLNGGERRVSQIRQMNSASAPFCTVESQNGDVLSHHETITSGTRQVLQETEGLGNEALTTTYQFDGNGKRYGYTRNDGSFEYRGKTTIPNEGEFDLVVRPWNGTVFGPNLDESDGVATLTRSQKVNGKTIETTIRYILGQEMSRTVATSVNTTADHLIYRDAQPVLEVTTQSYSSARPAVVQETVRQTYLSHALPSLAGQLAYEKHADGSSTIYHHFPRGSFDPGTGAFHPGQGNYRQVWAENRAAGPNGGAAVPFVTQNTITVYDASDHEVEQRVCVVDVQGKNKLLTITKTQYDQNGLETKASANNAEITSTIYDSAGRLQSHTDETGMVTTYSNPDANGFAQTETRQGYPAIGNLSAIPPRVTQRTYDALGRVKRVTKGSFAAETIYDSRGRIALEREGTLSGESLENTRTTSRIYTNLPSGIGTKEVVKKNGLSHSETIRIANGDSAVSGIGVLSTSITQELIDGNNEPTVPASLTGKATLHKMYVGEGVDKELRTASIRDGLGRNLAEYIFGCDAITGNRVGSWRYFQYDTAGRLINESVDGVLVKEYDYPSSGSMTETVHADPTQIRTQNRYFSLESGFWWEVVQSSQGVQKTQVSHLGRGGTILGTILTLDANGMLIQSAKTVDAMADGTVTTVNSVVGSGDELTTVSRGGLVQSITNSAGESFKYDYDYLGRQMRRVVPGNIVTDISYDSIYGQPENIVIFGNTIGPVASSTSSFTYYAPSDRNAGRLSSQVTDGRTVYASYTPRGEAKAVWGDRYPEFREYDHAGRLSKLHTYTSQVSGEPTGGGNVTQWIYRHGSLWKKLDALNRAIGYGYNNKGLLESRTWARGVSTTYLYDNAGQLQAKLYDDNGVTPDVWFSYDDKGYVTEVADSYFSIRRFQNTAYDPLVGHVVLGESESINWNVGEPNSSVRVNSSRTSVTGKLTAVNVAPPFELNRIYGLHQRYFYDTQTGKLDQVIAGASLFEEETSEPWQAVIDFEYTEGVPTPSHIEHSGGLTGTQPKIVSKHTHDGIGRIKRAETGLLNLSPKVYADYTYQNGFRKTANTDRGDWVYSYNMRGEVNGGEKKSNGVTVPGFQFGYSFDEIGNRTSSSVSGLDTIYPSAGTNTLNQYLARQNPKAATVRGKTAGLLTGSIVTSASAGVVGPDGKVPTWIDAKPFVNGSFAANVPIDTTTGARLEKVRVESTAQNNQGEYKLDDERIAILPKENETLEYDLDGNITKDGIYSYEWDAENRLITVNVRTDSWVNQTQLPGMPIGHMQYYYDPLGRRLVKTNAAVHSPPLQGTRFVYDHWNMIYEYNGILDKIYTWGPDLSGTVGGAGGVGGLLSVQFGTDGVPSRIVPAADGNGNISAYLASETGNVVEEHEYGPFGENLRPVRDNEQRCALGWSSKYTDEETGLLYFGYRYYSPGLGRWLSRDPIGEAGGVNLYNYVGNRAVDSIDPFGLSASTINCCCECIESISVGNQEAYNDKVFGPNGIVDLTMQSALESISPGASKEARARMMKSFAKNYDKDEYTSFGHKFTVSLKMKLSKRSDKKKDFSTAEFEWWESETTSFENGSISTWPEVLEGIKAMLGEDNVSGWNNFMKYEKYIVNLRGWSTRHKDRKCGDEFTVELWDAPGIKSASSIITRDLAFRFVGKNPSDPGCGCAQPEVIEEAHQRLFKNGKTIHEQSFSAE